MDVLHRIDRGTLQLLPEAELEEQEEPADDSIKFALSLKRNVNWQFKSHFKQTLNKVKERIAQASSRIKMQNEAHISFIKECLELRKKNWFVLNHEGNLYIDYGFPGGEVVI